MKKLSRVVFLSILCACYSSLMYAASCAKGEPGCSDCVPVPYPPVACAVNNCCVDGSGGTVSHSCVCTESNGTICTSCSSD